MKKIEIEKGIFITSDRCVWYEPEDTAVIADLHLGYETALKKDGVSLPLSQKEEILDRVSSIKNRYRPDTLVVLGDFKHNFGRLEDSEFHELLDVMDYMMEDTSLVMIRGNHDNYLKNLTDLKGIQLYQEKMKLGDITLTHGHKIIEWDGLLIMGHEHPSIKIRDEIGSTMKLPCYLHHENEKVLVLPAFSPFAQGRDVISSESFFSELLRGMDIKLRSFNIYALSEDGLVDFHSVGEVRDVYP